MMPLPRTASTLLCLAAMHGAPAQTTDPLRSPACREALAALDAEERRAASAPATGEARPALAGAKRRVASTCLARNDDVPVVPSRGAPPPVPAVPPVAPVPRAVSPELPPAPPTPRAPPGRTPITITGCDAIGCWSSDGTRLQRIGPDLLGPRGFCTTAGAVLNCP